MKFMYESAMVSKLISTKTTVSSFTEPFEVKWLGVIPKHWRLLRLKTIMNERTTKGYPEEPLLSSTQMSGVILQENYEDRTVLAMKDLHLLKLVHVGDFVISLRSFQGGIEFARDRGIISPSYTVIYPRNLEHHRYLAWLFKSDRFIENLKLHVTGIREGQNIDYERLSRSFIPIPPIEEQLIIVAYLDKLTLNIDAAKIQALRKVGILREYKRAVIQRAVTRGLDPDVPLKPSEVEWLGDIPEHWEVYRLKNACRFCYGDSLPSEDRIEGPIPVFGSNGQVDFHVSANTNGPCIVIGRKGSFGKVHYSREPVFAIDTTFFIDSRFTNANLRYLSYLLETLSLDSVSRDSAVPGLSREDAYQHMVAMPSFAEQTAIVAHLDKLTSDIDAAIAHTRREIELLEEYRTRLIADVVTGKLDVREAVANLPDVSSDDLKPLAESSEADD